MLDKIRKEVLIDVEWDLHRARHSLDSAGTKLSWMGFSKLNYKIIKLLEALEELRMEVIEIERKDRHERAEAIKKELQ